MKKTIKLLIITVIIVTLMPFTMVNAVSSKTEKIVETLEELAKSFDGTVNYEDDKIEIEWNTPNSKTTEVVFSYNGNVIEYNSGKITSYDEAEDVTNHMIYVLDLMESALELNGYSKEEIKTALNSVEYNLSYETNGIEIEQTGEMVTFTSENGSTTTISPIRIKIDVSKANLNKSPEKPLPTFSTTVSDVVENLASDSNYTTTEDGGKVVFEKNIYNDDDTITIDNTFYWEEYHSVSFSCENDVISYVDDTIDDYFDAEHSLSEGMYANLIITSALKMNGYTIEEIQEFLTSNEFDYEINGIECKQIGEEKKFTSPDGSSTITVIPASYKIDLQKANLNKKDEADEETTYKVLEGANQIYKIGENSNLTFKLDINYDKFKTYGEIWIDEMRIEEDKYTTKSGSTIITFNDEYTKTLAEGKHHIEIPLAQGRLGIAKTDFYIEKADVASDNKTTDIKETTHATDDVQKEQKAELATTSNPKTGDNIVLYVVMAVASVVLIVALIVIIKKRKY